MFLKKNILEILNKKLNEFENGARECKIIILILRFHAELNSFCILLASIDYFYNNFDNKKINFVNRRVELKIFRIMEHCGLIYLALDFNLFLFTALSG